jgi:S1-C subfamily serine protease
MVRALVLATLVALLPFTAAVQAPSVLHIKVILPGADGTATPVPRHALLISDNPPTAAPRRIVTALDGTADVRLRPGSYTVESDQPVTFQGKAHTWVQTVDISAGRDAVLELTSANAEIEETPATAAGGATLESDPYLLVPQWQDSVVAVWTPNAHASGFVIDSKGLIATNQRVVGTATSVEVQLTPTAKVPAAVLAADPTRDVAVLWIDPRAITATKPVPLGCTQAARPTIASGQDVFTISVPLRQPKGITPGTVKRVDATTIVSDLVVAPGGTGGPVFNARGELVGITSLADATEEYRRGGSRVLRSDAACDVVASAEKKLNDATPPSGALLPVEPARPFPAGSLQEIVERRAGSLSPYQTTSSSFDVAFITPPLIYGAQYQSERARRRTTSKDTRKPDLEPPVTRSLMDFGNWSDYAADFPPVLLVRVTPKLVEGFWTAVGRYAARTQGVSLPPIGRVKSGFSRLRAFCGDAEVTPIHPFKLERRLSEKEVIYEGLYVFDPDALGPQCGSVKLALYSEKEPDKADTRVVEPAVIQQIWQDFEPYRHPH